MDRYFWEALGDFGDSTALITGSGEEVWSYRRLKDAVETGRRRLSHDRKQVIFLSANNDIGSVLCYLSALAAGQPVHLGRGAAQWSDAHEFLESFCPDILLWKGDQGSLPPQYEKDGELFGYQVAKYRESQDPVGEGVALLLSTSGSIANPKLVRLSHHNLAASARQVGLALRLCPSQRAITSLPLNFVYGLSVVHAHLNVGASLVLTGRSVQDRAFWQLINKTGVTGLAAVPWTLRLMQSISFNPVLHPTLRNLCLSGGALESAQLRWLNELAAGGLNIFSMYGQTETTGRMCVLPPEFLHAKPGSVGLPVEGSSVTCGVDGAIMFRGPNVMLGYAMSRQDLNGVDNQKGVLLTGDAGHLDPDGCLYITGRLSRIAKLFGMRMHLDEIEAFLGDGISVAVESDDQILAIFVEKAIPAGLEWRLEKLLQRLRVPPHCARIHVLDEFPRTEAGKIRYGALPRSGGYAARGRP